MSEQDACPTLIQPAGASFYFVDRPDGTRLRYACWSSRRDGTKGSIMLFPGRSEFIEKYYEVIGDLLDRGFGVACVDWRNQGLSSRPLANTDKHYITDFSLMLDDMDAVWEDLMTRGLSQPWYLLAHSMGGHLGLRYLHRHPERFQKAIMTSPMVSINYGGIPRPLARFMGRFLTRIGLGKMYALGQMNYGPLNRTKVSMNLITSDQYRFDCEHRWIDINPALSLGGVTWGWLDAARRSIDRLSSAGYAEAVTTPLLVLQAGREKLVDNAMQVEWVKRAPHATLQVVEGALHEILSEQDMYRDQFWKAFDDFVR